MLLLMYYKNTRDQQIINSVINIIIFLSNRGLNKFHTDINERNLMDYIEDYGWSNIKFEFNIDNILYNLGIKSDIFKNITKYLSFKDYLIIIGFPKKTGKLETVILKRPYFDLNYETDGYVICEPLNMHIPHW